MYISAQGFIDLDLDKVSLFLYFQILGIFGKCGEDRAVGTRLFTKSQTVGAYRYINSTYVLCDLLRVCTSDEIFRFYVTGHVTGLDLVPGSTFAFHRS